MLLFYLTLLELQVIYPHHHPKFTIDESSMLVAAEAVGAVVLNYLTIE